jgi:hypothetical protein
LTDLIDHSKKNKIHKWFSEDEQDHYIIVGEICRIRKEVLRADIQLDANNAHLTWIWVDKLQLQGDFVYYKDKQDPSLEGLDLDNKLFILYIQILF